MPRERCQCELASKFVLLTCLGTEHVIKAPSHAARRGVTRLKLRTVRLRGRQLRPVRAWPASSLLFTFGVLREKQPCDSQARPRQLWASQHQHRTAPQRGSGAKTKPPGIALAGTTNVHICPAPGKPAGTWTCRYFRQSLSRVHVSTVPCGCMHTDTPRALPDTPVTRP